MAGVPGKGGRSRAETGLAGEADKRGRAHSRLDEAAVADGLAQAAANGWGAPALGRYLGVSTPTATQILSGKTWQHVPRPAALRKQQAERTARLSDAQIEAGLRLARAEGWGAHRLARHLDVSPATASRYLATKGKAEPAPVAPVAPVAPEAPPARTRKPGRFDPYASPPLQTWLDVPAHEERVDTVIATTKAPARAPAAQSAELMAALGTDLDPVIAARFGLSPSRVQQLREAAGIPAFVAVRREAIRSVAGSKSDAALAAEMGVDRKTIRKHRREAGIGNEYNEAVAAREAHIRALIAANPGASLRAIAAEAGVNATTVMRIKRGMGEA